MNYLQKFHWLSSLFDSNLLSAMTSNLICLKDLGVQFSLAARLSDAKLGVGTLLVYHLAKRERESAWGLRWLYCPSSVRRGNGLASTYLRPDSIE